MVDITKFKPPGINVQHLEVNEGLRRISVDGEVNGRYASVVFQEAEIPNTVRTDAKWYAYLQKRLQATLPHNNLLPGVIEAIIGGAALRLFDVQNNDGGWEWMNPDRESLTNPSPANTMGVTAQGILDAYKRNDLAPLLAAVVSAYDCMLAYSGDPYPSKHRIRGPDIPYCVELSEVTEDSLYATFAKAQYLSALTEFGGGTATGFAEFIRDIRVGQSLPSVAPWDINLYIQGCLALHGFDPDGGFDQHAKDMAEVIYACIYGEPVVFDITDPTQSEFWVGITGALEAFKTTGLYPDKVTELADLLVARQEDDGHFVGVVDGSNVQTTAYAVMALLKVGTKEEAVHLAIDYLAGCQMSNSGWEYQGTENTEVTSEAAQALHDFLEVETDAD